jgi:uncharacterized protein (TIGR02611 family)
VSDALRVLRRITITVVGFVVLLVGVVMLVAPGPGFVVIALGLLILSAEYEWARRHFRTAKTHAQSLAERAAANRVSTVLTVLFALGAIALGGVLALTQFLPASGAATGGSVAFGGLVILATVIYSLIQRRKLLAAERRDE